MRGFRQFLTTFMHKLRLLFLLGMLGLLSAGRLYAMQIIFDYSYDTTGFFSIAHPERRAALAAAAEAFGPVNSNSSTVFSDGSHAWSWNLTSLFTA